MILPPLFLPVSKPAGHMKVYTSPEPCMDEILFIDLVPASVANPLIHSKWKCLHDPEGGSDADRINVGLCGCLTTWGSCVRYSYPLSLLDLRAIVSSNSKTTLTGMDFF